MSEQVSIHTSGEVVRPFTIRQSDEVRAQLEVLAEINGRSATEESRIALADWVTRAKDDPELKKRAAGVQNRLNSSAEVERKRIEREAEEKRKAIAAVLGDIGVTPTPAKPGTARGGKPAAADGNKASGTSVSGGASATASTRAATSKKSPARSTR
ncbi:hypothetical protein [Nesterenkonia muleiensis]|uniref:hypothetical protein n=1 Tax=Nesterenkonia muleiensis TaxID=2282648 RepID=UPI000E716CFD|nr:hypothetical protein [Nesterenkonia muleiensis]